MSQVLLQEGLLQSWPSESSCEMGNIHCSEGCAEADKHVVSDGLIRNIDGDPSNTQSVESKSVTRKGRIKLLVSKLGTTLDRILFVDESPPQSNDSRRVHGGVLLHGCDTPEEHFDRHDVIIATMKDCQLTSVKGLQAAGLEFELRKCSTCLLLDEEKKCEDSQNEEGNDCPDAMKDYDSIVQFGLLECEDCCTRLVHRQSETLVERDNRRKFISDGQMYDEVSRCCMEFAQDFMIKEYGMKWITIDSENEGYPIRALVTETHPAAGGSSISRPTVLIITGKGKVGAGIFSRQHIQTTGVEPSTALFTIKQAKMRNMNVVLLDPNVNGERKSYMAVEKSMSKLFNYIEETADDENASSRYPLLIQAHSAAGGNIVRYLMDKSHCYLQHLQAIAFTDSTHNIQWVNKHPELSQFLESSAAIYFRSSKNEFGYSQPQPAGEDMSPDSSWLRRFGKIRTCWAGTTEHSLSDWSARKHIWEHFDKQTNLQALDHASENENASEKGSDSNKIL
mmetsp:Transcript_6781/g.9901  ORF Transcript_6781/g.9901 Transcript_6781/m.9901 type:complete len:508 (-) Transcript_6781:106-1629(-)